MIHPTAIVHAKAHIDPTVEIGPYSIVDEHVSLGPNCRIAPHVYLTGHTKIGANNQFFSGCVIGEAPQDLKYKNEPTRLIIGDNNVFREQVTVQRSNKMQENTVLGSNCFLMANSHVAHNCVVGNNVILANGALLGGHVTVEDRVFVSGNCLVHQFCRIGTLALMQGGSGISKDLPPFTIARGNNGICGLNVIGLRRAGFKPEERLELKQLYHALFRNEKNLTAAVADADARFQSGPAKLMLSFVKAAKRGVCRDFGSLSDEGESEEI